MTRSLMSLRSLLLGCAALLLATTTVRADEKDGKGKDKGKKDEKPNIVQLDLSKLPPDLAKALQKYATDSKKPAAPAKGQAAEKKPSGRTTLPPGLAKKAANHPGRVAWLKAHGAAEPEKGKKKDDEKGKKKDEDKGKKKDDEKGKKKKDKDD